MGNIVTQLAFPYPNKKWSLADLLARERSNQLVYLTTRSGFRIPAVYIQSDGAKTSIIYSHGNAEDVGLSLPYLDRLSQRCNCNVFAYEYCGYSIAEGEPSEKNCYECIDAAYQYLIKRKQESESEENCTSREKQKPSSASADSSRIVLFGRSLGTGPTVDLAARLLSKNDSNLDGVILQSPLASAGRCVLGVMASYALYPFDLFRSYEKIEKLAPIPVFVMHGVDDKVVPCASGEALYASLVEERKRLENLRKGSTGTRDNKDGVPDVTYQPKWLAGVGHNDMPEFHCMNDVTKFLRFVEEL